MEDKTMKQGPFRYDQVGSLLRTKNLKQARKALENNEISLSVYKQIERVEVAEIVNKQKALGLKAITDGEFNREYWHYDFISHLNGIECYVRETKGSFQGVMQKLKAYYVKDHVSFPKNHPFIDDFIYLKSLVNDDAVAKFTIPGPNMVYFTGVVNSPVFQTQSNLLDIAAVKQDIATTYQQAIQCFYEAGCRYLQFDDVSWGALFCESAREQLMAQGVDPEQLVKELAELNIESLKNKPEDMVITTHCCRGNFKSSWLYEGDYTFVQNDIFRAPFDGFFLEFDTNRAGSFAPIQHLKHGKLVLGLITSKNGVLEDKQEVIRRIQEAQSYVNLDQLCLSCQCGFSSTEDGNDLSEEEQYQKLAFVKEIADEIWQDA